MKALKNSTQLLAEAKQLEQASRLTEAAAAYQHLVDADPTNQQAVSRLLTIYRRLKEPKNELAVIEGALTAYAQKNKASQDKWLTAHPEAARAGRAFLRSLGDDTVSGFGANPAVERLLKRKEVVEKKLGKSKRKTKGKTKTKSIPAAATKRSAAQARRDAAQARRDAAEAHKREAQKKKAEAAARKAEAAARKAEAAVARKAEAARRAAERKAARAAKLAAQKAATLSLFVLSLRYLAAPEKLDATLAKHNAFINKHIATGVFLAAGRQVPPTGDIIIARGKDRAAIEHLIKQDPFIKGKLASVDIVEFSAEAGRLANPK